MPRRICILLLTLFTAVAVHSVSRHSSSEDEPSPGVGTAGLRVAIDPATGRIIDSPSPDRLRRDDRDFATKRKSDRELRSFDLPSGAVGVALEGWAHHATRVVRAADGTFSVVCSQGDDHGGVR